VLSNPKWRAHAIALATYASAAAIYVVIVETRPRGGLFDLDLGLAFSIAMGLVPFLAIAIPTTAIVAARRSGGAGYAIVVHALTLFVCMMTFWWMQG
jgi:hypothetical protein